MKGSIPPDPRSNIEGIASKSVARKGQRLPIVCEMLESELAQSIKSSVITLLVELASSRLNIVAESVTPDCFTHNLRCEGQNYSVMVTHHPDGCGTLNVVVSSVSASGPKLARKSVRSKIEPANGRCTAINVRAASPFDVLADEITRHCKETVEAIYRFQVEQVKISIESSYRDTGDPLYHYLRTILPQRLIPYVWMHVIADGNGAYLPDIHALDTPFIQASRREFAVRQSACALVAEFFTKVTPIKQTAVAQYCLAEDKTIAVSIAGVHYAGSPFQIAEQTIMGHDDLCAQPLVRDSRVASLNAAYPTAMRDEIEPVLLAGRHAFKQIIEANATGLRRTINQVRSQELPIVISDDVWPSVGQILYGFWKAAMSGP